MTSNDIERIEKFMDTFELSMNDIFCFLGVGVCQIGVKARLEGDINMENLHHEMDDYIFNDILAHKEIYKNDM